MSPSTRRSSTTGLAILAALVLGGGLALAALNGTLTVSWNPNTTDPDLAGYRVFLATDPNVFTLTPALAAAQATTRLLDPNTTQTTFTALDPARTYWVAVTSIDTSSNESVFSNVASARPADVTPPTVSLSAPASGATVRGNVTVSATATDDVGVAGVQFKVDGVNVGVEDTTSPYSITWSSTAVADGAHTITAVARDAAGNTATSTGVTVTVDNIDTNPPTVSLTAPAAGASVSGTVTISANAADDIGVAGVQFKVNGANQGAEDTTSPYSISWNTTLVANGSYTLTAVARDAAGNTTTSAPITVTVSNADTTPPTVSITAPAAGATVSGSVSVAANASDNVGVAGVQFKLNGANLGTEDTTSPYSISWNTALSANGSYTLTAVARDAAGNTTTSAGVTVTVSNADTTPPTVSITAPVAGATVTSTVTITASASDNVGVAGVKFFVNGTQVGVEDTAAPYSISWDSKTVVNGTYTLTAVARDAAGNTTTSAGITVTVGNADTTPPAPPTNVRVF